MPQLNEDGYGKKRSHCRQNSSPCKCTAVCFSTQAFSIYLSTQALSLRELRILLRRWSRINFLDYISWKNTKGLLQWTFNHISPSTALQHFQGRLSIQEDQKFFEIDLIFVYKGNLLLHFFVNKKAVVPNPTWSVHHIQMYQHQSGEPGYSWQHFWWNGFRDTQKVCESDFSFYFIFPSLWT